MKKWFTNNLGLKFLALFGSFLLWLIVVNINDPVDYQTFTGVQVEIINANAITDEGKIYEILDNTNVITVRVAAKRSILDALSKENIRAVADLSEVTITNTVSIKLSTNKYNSSIENIDSNTEYLKLNIEDIKRKQLVIDTVTTGTPADGYLVGAVSSDQNLVRLSGPESVIAKISSAQVIVDVSGMNENISTSAELRLYDADGKQIINDSITANITAVNVNVSILATKMVPITYQTSGTPADGYDLTGEIISNPEEILIAGSQSQIDKITVIEVPETALNVTGQTENLTVFLNINEYLPSGIILGDKNFKGSVSVEVVIEKIETKKITIPESSIRLDNIPDGYEVSILDYDPESSISLKAISSRLEELENAAWVGTVDIGGYFEDQNISEPASGIYTVEAEFVMPENVEQVQRLYIKVELTAVESENNDNSENA